MGELLFVGYYVFDADFLDVGDGCAEACNAFEVARACFKFVREFCVFCFLFGNVCDHVASEEEGFHLFEEVFASEEYADA